MTDLTPAGSPMGDPAGPAKPSKANRVLEFMAGFFGIILMNCALAGLYVLTFQLPLPAEVYAPLASGFGLLALLVNVAALIVLAFKRPPVALGILSAYAAAFVVVLCVGTLISVICFNGTTNL